MSEQKPGWCIVKKGQVLLGPFFEDAEPDKSGQCNRGVKLSSGDLKWGFSDEGRYRPSRRLQSVPGN